MVDVNGLIGGNVFIDNVVMLFGLACGCLCLVIAALALAWSIYDSIHGCHVIGIHGVTGTSGCVVVFSIGDGR